VLELGFEGGVFQETFAGESLEDVGLAVLRCSKMESKKPQRRAESGASGSSQ
jgi:hypothetical protein